MNKLTLYTYPQSRGTIVVWMLKECGAAFDTVLLPFGEAMKSAEYLAVNPMGKVPALKAGDTVITETAAIVTFLAEQFPEKNLIPAAGTLARGEYYRWLCFALQLEYAAFDRRNQIQSSEERRNTIGYGDFDTAFGTLRRHLAAREFIVGNRFSALDIYYAMLLAQFTRVMPVPGLACDVFEQYINRHTERAAFGETMAWVQEKLAQMNNP
ncbi:glutathione S-transferase family protein [Neisseria sp. 23W00296]|uniref:glutathione S-transferase family protein n=1 Tax=unclassified Neisseria TaxID=2623750 RepID=UPI0002A32BC4|nr:MULTISPECIES: glutathione S-transferase family protein [unclassified Neisseria]ASP17813.1 glutathione S-transferase family protein [Neisseria sp. KEM232]EKY10474.1 glutathione S-transferase protein [Neisseria sp. oral taxon 020 str. F0370]